MEILSNFASIYCYISFVIGAVLMLVALSIAAMGKDDEPRNKVHFYVARNNDGKLNVFFNKPSRNYNFKKWRQYDFSKHWKGKYKWESTRIVEGDYFDDLGLNPDDFKYLKWEDEPVEVYLNLKK